MARIRSVKPELRTSDLVASWPIEARYFFVLLWGYLDDKGRGLDSPKRIVGDCFPHDERITPGRVDGWLKLMTHGLQKDDPGPICRYEVKGRRYLHSVNWSEHQRPNRPTPSRLPPCPIHEADTETLTESARESPTEPVREPPRGNSVPGIRQQGSRGSSGTGARETHPPRSASQKRADELNATSRRADTQRLINTWETERGSPLLADARRQWTAAIDRVLDEGADQGAVADALPVLAARGLGPTLLASVIEEQRGKRAARPIHERGPDEVTDAELTRQALDDLLGEDCWQPPPCPDEIDRGPLLQRRAWFAARLEERQAERRIEARRVLARNNGAPA